MPDRAHDKSVSVAPIKPLLYVSAETPSLVHARDRRSWEWAKNYFNPQSHRCTLGGSQRASDDRHVEGAELSIDIRHQLLKLRGCH
jgi:hypothetical protein